MGLCVHGEVLCLFATFLVTSPALSIRDAILQWGNRQYSQRSKVVNATAITKDGRKKFCRKIR